MIQYLVKSSALVFIHFFFFFNGKRDTFTAFTLIVTHAIATCENSDAKEIITEHVKPHSE